MSRRYDRERVDGSKSAVHFKQQHSNRGETSVGCDVEATAASGHVYPKTRWTVIADGEMCVTDMRALRFGRGLPGEPTAGIVRQV